MEHFNFTITLDNKEKTKFEHYADLVKQIVSIAEEEQTPVIFVPAQLLMVFAFAGPGIFKRANPTKIYGPYLAGTLKDKISVVVSPELTNYLIIGNQVGSIE